jgi:hypothetical protein
MTNNELFATHLKWDFEPPFSGGNSTRFQKWLCPFNSYWVTERDMKFNLDWNWFHELWDSLAPLINSESLNLKSQVLIAKAKFAILDSKLLDACQLVAELIEENTF